MIKYYVIERWGWECPCGQFNEEENEPDIILICETCGKEFEDFEEE